jgi:hypothetical protein
MASKPLHNNHWALPMSSRTPSSARVRRQGLEPRTHGLESTSNHRVARTVIVERRLVAHDGCPKAWRGVRMGGRSVSFVVGAMADMPSRLYR